MQNNLLNLIEENMSSFSKSHRLIAKYILDNYDKVAYFTASKLGKDVGISESTVVRFATELGFEGYPELQREIRAFMKVKLTSVQRLEVAANNINDENILETVLNQDIEKIRKTLENCDTSKFNLATEEIVKAKNIYIIGAKSASFLANFLSYNMNLIFDNVRQINPLSTGELFEQIVRIGKDDVIIGISFPRYSKLTISAFKYASDNGAKVIALTDNNSSPLTKYANISLFAQSDMMSFVDSFVAPLSIINALLVALSIKNKGKVSENLSKLENMWEEYQVYEKYE